MATRISSQRLTVISFLHSFRTPDRCHRQVLVHPVRQVELRGSAGFPVLPTETPVVLEENVMKGLPVSVVTVANRHWEFVARRTMTPRPPNTHDWWEQKLQPRKDTHVNAE